MDDLKNIRSAIDKLERLTNEIYDTRNHLIGIRDFTSDTLYKSELNQQLFIIDHLIEIIES